MQIQINGELKISELRQALYEKLIELEDDLAVHFSRGATLYVNPTDGLGQPVVPHRHGRVVDKMICQGPYRSAADDFKV